MNTITITLNLPPSCLAGHAKGHWREKAAATKRCRQGAYTVATAQLNRRTPPMWAHATISYRFFLPDDRRRDAANLVSACKGYIDGIVDAAIIVDDDWKILSIGSVKCELDRDNPRVEITLAAIQEALK